MSVNSTDSNKPLRIAKALTMVSVACGSIPVELNKFRHVECLSLLVT